jgi:membrane protease YdiL (CAAX protease family)
MIIKIIVESVLPLLLILPLAILFIKDRKQAKTLGLFSFTFIFHQIVLKLPMDFQELQIIHSKWNWIGKLFGIIMGLTIYYFLRNKLKPFDFLQFKQDPKTLKKTFLLTMITTCFAFFPFFYSALPFDTETLIYQLTMPGFDEEIMFRAILLGLLLSCFKEVIKIGKRTYGNPSILVIGLLFGLVHGIEIKDNLSLKIEIYPIIFTFIYGYIWSWTTMESKSILQATISHNVSNFVGHVLKMIK